MSTPVLDAPVLSNGAPDAGPPRSGTPAPATLTAPRLVTPLPGPKTRALLERDRAVMSPSYTRGYPLAIARGEGAVVEDPDGNRFLDFTAGIAVCSTGHSHPDVVAAIRRQAGRYLHMSGTDFYYEPQIELAERLARSMPGPGAWKVFFTNSGTESIEAAIKLARHHTRRPKLVGFFGSFHGRTMGSLSLTASKPRQRARFAPLVPEVHHAPYANCGRCPINLRYPDCKVKCADWLEDVLFKHQAPPDEVAAVVVEPVQGEGGYVVPPAEFLPKLRALCDRHGILMIVDEVQSGMGRTGKMWAVEHFGVAPDIIATAKGIASGMPLGAIIARADVMDWPPGSHASTFGGNPVSCAAALATMDLLEGGLMGNATAMGRRIMAGLADLPSRCARVTAVRGLGLMIGVEFVEDRATRKPSGKLRDVVVDACYERGLLVLPCGEATLRLCPPLTITEQEADTAVAILRATIAAETGATAV